MSHQGPHPGRGPPLEKTEKTRLSQKHIGEATVHPTAILGKGCKRSKHNMPEGREGTREEAGRSFRLRGHKYRPQARKSQTTGRKKTRNHGGRKRELDQTRRLVTGITIICLGPNVTIHYTEAEEQQNETGWEQTQKKL